MLKHYIWSHLATSGHTWQHLGLSSISGYTDTNYSLYLPFPLRQNTILGHTWSHLATPGYHLATSGHTWQHLVTSNGQHTDTNWGLYSKATYQIWISRPFFGQTLIDRAGSRDKCQLAWDRPSLKIWAVSGHRAQTSSHRYRQTDGRTDAGGSPLPQPSLLHSEGW